MTSKVKQIVLGKNTIWCAFYKTFATFSLFEKIQDFFRKNQSIFSKKKQTKYRVCFEKYYYFSALYGKFAECWGKNSRSEA